jgi:hypothetical protein
MMIRHVNESYMESQYSGQDMPNLRAKETRMRGRLSDASIGYLFPKGKGAPCAHGLELLFAFMIERPTDFTFLEPSDFTRMESSGFIGISEWDDVARHYTTCGLCHG